MRTTNRSTSTFLALAMILALAGVASAETDAAEGHGDGYQDGSYGRIRFADGGATILRADGEDDDHDRAGVNAPIFPGDTVRTAGDQRVEVQLAAGTLVRLDRGSAVVFQSMPDPYAKVQDNVVLALHAGAIRIATRLGEKDEFRIDTDAGSVYLLGDGDFRIETDGQGRTTVASLRGVAEVVGSEGSVLVRGGSRTAVSAGSVPQDPRAYSSFASDGFDRWCEVRDAAYRDRDAQNESTVQGDVPYEVRPYYRELSTYGTWTVVPDYGRVWYPTGVAAGWRPYYDGYWAYGPGGYFWVSSEPWGWAPYRYGNWQWVGSYGWCWVPGRVFAGAWVSWSWGSLYLGWAPLDYWGRPCYRYGGYRYGYYDPGSWTFVSYTNVHVTNVSRYAVPVGKVGADLRGAHVVTRAPRVSPSQIATSREARERAVRQVAEDRAAAVRPSPAGRVPGRKLEDIQQDVLRRSPRETSGTSRGAAVTPRSPQRTIESPAERFPRRVVQDTRGRGDDASGTTRQARPQVRGSERSVERPRAGPVGPARSDAPYPRRVVEDPRRSVRAEAPARPDARTNVRKFYERMSRPRETRGSDASRIPARVESPRPHPESAQPRASAPRQQPPSAQPQAPAPRPQGQPRTGGGRQGQGQGQAKPQKRGAKG